VPSSGATASRVRTGSTSPPARRSKRSATLTLDDVIRYKLPPDFTKATDTRRSAFVARWGDIAVELDALPLDALRNPIIAEVESRMDLAALRRVREREAAERGELAAALGGFA
jgi:hypothetical protein